MNTQESLIRTMEKLVQLNTSLIQLCFKQQPAFVGFDIEKIKSENEQVTLRDGINTLDVKLLNNIHELNEVLSSISNYYKSDGLSTKFVSRLPGVIVITQNVEQVKILIDDINSTKDKIATIVRKDRDQYERHKFIHDTFRFIMTEQVYRHVHYFEHEVTNVWFNWASRPVPKTFTIDEAITMLTDQLDRPKYLMSQEEWTRMITKTINNVNSGMFDYIQQIKEYRVLPTVELQYIESVDVKKRKKCNATTPIILLGQSNNQVPKYSALNAYVNKRKNKVMKLSPNKTLLNSYLKLVGVKNLPVNK